MIECAQLFSFWCSGRASVKYLLRLVKLHWPDPCFPFLMWRITCRFYTCTNYEIIVYLYLKIWIRVRNFQVLQFKFVHRNFNIRTGIAWNEAFYSLF